MKRERPMTGPLGRGGGAWGNKTLHTQKSVKPLSALPSPDQSDIHQQCDSPLGELQERSKVVFLLLIRATQAALDLEISKKKKKKGGGGGSREGKGGEGGGEPGKCHKFAEHPSRLRVTREKAFKEKRGLICALIASTVHPSLPFQRSQRMTAVVI